jgi:hypothetical protein
MIVTISNPYGLIKGQLKKWKKIGVIACNTCARICETGGKEAMEKLVTRLRADGFEVVDEDVIPMTCNLDMAEKGDYQGDILIILGCDSGFATFQALYPNKRIVNGNKTVGLGSRDRNGNIFVTEEIK